MKTKRFIRERKKLLEGTLKQIVILYGVNRELVWGLPRGTYAQRRKQYEIERQSAWDNFWASAYSADRITKETRKIQNTRYSYMLPKRKDEWKSAYNVNTQPSLAVCGKTFDNIEKSLFEAYKLDVKSDSPSIADVPKWGILDVFKTLFEDATLITGEELRSEIPEDWPEYTSVKEGDYDKCQKACFDNLLMDSPKNMEKMRLQLHREKLFPRADSWYIRYSPTHKGRFGEECFAPSEQTLCEVSEYSLAEFNGIFGALTHSIKGDSDLRLKISGNRIDEWDYPEPVNSEIAIQGARSVYKVVEEFFLTPKDHTVEQVFTSPFEHKLYEFLGRDLTTYSVFSGTWGNFAEFVASLLVTYFYYTESFDRFCLCNQCGKLFFPDKYSKAKNKYCSDRCRKESHRAEDEVSCYNRQYAWFRNNHRKVHRFIINNNDVFYHPREFVTISRKEVCSGGGCPYEVFPAGGKCSRFAEANPQIFPVLKEIKVKNKK